MHLPIFKVRMSSNATDKTDSCHERQIIEQIQHNHGDSHSCLFSLYTLREFKASSHLVYMRSTHAQVQAVGEVS